MAEINNQTSVEQFGYTQELKRGLTFPMLCAYGINWVGPLGPAVIFGFLLVDSGGAPALAYLLAGIAMLFTAASYAALSPNFPLAGSAYSYVSKGMSPYIGFLLGWAMILDYVFFPAGATMSMAIYVHTAIPAIPYALVLVVVALLTFTVNIIGVEIMAKIGFGLLAISLAVLSTSVAVILYYVGALDGGIGHIFTTMPFHYTSWSGLMLATSLAVYNFVGFDAVTTLAEETKNPIRDIPRAVYFTVIGAMVIFAGQSYVSTLAIPNWQSLIAASGQGWVESALYHVNVIAGGEKFGVFYMAGFVFVVIVFNIVCTTAAVRLLYGMGRDNLLPKKFFGKINKKFQTPHWNVVLVSSLIVIFGLTLEIEQISLLINFGALLGFIGINITCYYVFYRNNKKVKIYQVNPENRFAYFLRYALIPLIGAIVCTYLFASMTGTTYLVGSCWLLLGVILLAFKTKFFKKLPPEIKEC